MQRVRLSEQQQKAVVVTYEDDRFRAYLGSLFLKSADSHSMLLSSLRGWGIVRPRLDITAAREILARASHNTPEEEAAE